MQSLEEENDSFPLNYPGNYLRFQRNPFHIKTKCCFFRISEITPRRSFTFNLEIHPMESNKVLLVYFNLV